MAKLTDEQKYFITQSLACFDTPSVIVEAVKEEFAIAVTPSQVQAYDPTKFQGRALSKKYKDIFEATRQAFLDEKSQIPIASKAYRLRTLQRLLDFYVSRKNMVQAQSVLEQAAKETGGMFTNRLQLKTDPASGLIGTLNQLLQRNTALPIVHEVEGEIIEG